MKKINLGGVLILSILLSLSACSKDQQLPSPQTATMSASRQQDVGTGSVKGRLYPVPLTADIYLYNESGTYYTKMNMDGSFFLDGIPGGTYHLKIDFTYESRFNPRQQGERIIDGVEVTDGNTTSMGQVELQWIN
jgi:hypothetical protein